MYDGHVLVLWAYEGKLPGIALHFSAYTLFPVLIYMGEVESAGWLSADLNRLIGVFFRCDHPGGDPHAHQKERRILDQPHAFSDSLHCPGGSQSAGCLYIGPPAGNCGCQDHHLLFRLRYPGGRGAEQIQRTGCCPADGIGGGGLQGFDVVYLFRASTLTKPFLCPRVFA